MSKALHSPRRKFLKIFSGPAFMFLIYSSPFILEAQEQSQEQPKPRIYFSSTSFSFLLTQGNNSNLSYSIDTDQNLNLGKNLFNIRGNAIYSKAQNQQRSEIYYSHIKYDRQLSSKAYLLGFTRFERNKLAGYNFRFAVTTGGGYAWVKKEKIDISSEVSLGWSGENNLVRIASQIGLIEQTRSTSFVSSILSSKLIYTFSSTAQLTIQEVLFSNLSDPEAYRVNSYSSLSTSINRNLGMKTSIQVTYEHKPVAGYKPTDVYFISSFVIKI